MPWRLVAVAIMQQWHTIVPLSCPQCNVISSDETSKLEAWSMLVTQPGSHAAGILEVV
jgi:hypothetical protein